MTKLPAGHRVAVAVLGSLWAVAWLLDLASLDRNVVIVPFYVTPAASAEAHPVVSALPAWTRAAAQPEPALAPGDAVLAVGGEPMRGAGTLRVVSHAWVAMAGGPTLAVSVERAGAPLDVTVAIPASIPKWPVLIVSAVFGACGIGAALRFGHLRFARLAAYGLLFYALWLGAYFGRTPSEMLGAFWLRAGALAALLPATMAFLRHFPEGHDDHVRWARGWPWLFAVQGLFFLDAEMFGRLPAMLSDLGPKLLTTAATALLLGLGTINYRRAAPAGRRRFKWMLVGVYAGMLPPTVVATLSAIRPELGAWFLPSQLAQLAIPAAVGVGLWPGGSVDVDRLWNATFVYLGGAALVAVGWVVGVPVAAEALARPGALDPETARVLCAAGVLAVAAPLAVFARRRLDDWVLAERREREAQAAALGRAVATSRKLEEVATRLAEGLPGVVGARAAVVHADHGPGFGPVASHPPAAAPPEVRGGGRVPSLLATAEAPVFGSEAAPSAGLAGDEVWVPLRTVETGGGAGRLAGFVVIGPREDGLPHDPGLGPLLAAVADRAGAMLTAFEQETLLRDARALSHELAREREDTERVSRAKTSLLAAASHDLRQPLHALGLFLDALEARVSDDDARDLLDNARDSARSMKRMFEALLDVSQVDAGMLRPEVEDLALDALFGDLARDFGPTAERRGLSLRVRPTALRVRSDAALLRSILQNLVGNALRFTERGGVLVGARRRGGRVRIEVWDTGPGIADERRERLFAEWQRGDDPDEDGGFGLGLTIVRRLSGLLGHQVALASRPGRGSVFSLTAEAASGERPPGAAPQRVLVVDDDPDVRAALVALLGGWGFAAQAAASASAAHDHAADSDAMLVDLELGDGESGLDLIDAWPAVPACVVTGAGRAAAEQARARGLLVLEKPVEPVRLRAALDHLLSR